MANTLLKVSQRVQGGLSGRQIEAVRQRDQAEALPLHLAEVGLPIRRSVDAQAPHSAPKAWKCQERSSPAGMPEGVSLPLRTADQLVNRRATVC